MANFIPAEESSIGDLDPRLTSQFEKATIALREGQHNYAREVAVTWVQRYPNVPEFRMLLREAQLQQIYPDRSYHLAARHRSYAFIPRLYRREKDPSKILEKCEKILSTNPLNLQANEALADTAGTLGWIRTEVFALQTMLLHPQRRPDHVIRLIQVLLSGHQVDHAREVCETFLKVFPDHNDLISIRNQISIQQSIQQVDS